MRPSRVRGGPEPSQDAVDQCWGSAEGDAVLELAHRIGLLTDDECRRHFADINGSVRRTADALITLSSEVRTQREESRLRDERVVAAAEASRRSTR